MTVNAQCSHLIASRSTQRAGKTIERIMCRAVCQGIGPCEMESPCHRCSPEQIERWRQGLRHVRVVDAHIPVDPDQVKGFGCTVDEALSGMTDLEKSADALVKSVRRGHQASAAAMRRVADHLAGDRQVLSALVEAAGEAGEPMVDVLAAAKEYGL